MSLLNFKVGWSFLCSVGMNVYVCNGFASYLCFAEIFKKHFH